MSPPRTLAISLQSLVAKDPTTSAVVVLGLENEFSLLNLLDSRPADERHGDDEWRPLHDDPTRPVSVDQLKAALPWASEVYADFGSRTFVRADVAATSRPGELPSEGMVLGAVQVPPDGRPVVFLADHPTTGGYPVIAVVRTEDLTAAAQAVPGTPVHFTAVRRR